MSEDLLTEAKSLLEWLDAWGDGPNWSDASGATVPIVKASLRRVLKHVIAHPPAAPAKVTYCTRCPFAMHLHPTPPEAGNCPGYT